MANPAFQFYPGDWLKSLRTAQMTLAEEGAYLRALSFCWNNGYLPNDPKKLAFIIGKGCTEEIATVIINMFLVDGNDTTKLIHDRLEKERIKQENYSKGQSRKGKKGMKSRWNRGKQEHNRGYKSVITQLLPDDNSSSSSSSSSSINSTNVELQASPEKKSKYGNKGINEMLIGLKGHIGISAFADSAIERNIARHCVNLIGKIGAIEFRRRLDIILQDSFKHKNCNRIKYVYNEIKSFIEPKTKQSSGIFIS